MLFTPLRVKTDYIFKRENITKIITRVYLILFNLISVNLFNKNQYLLFIKN